MTLSQKFQKSDFLGQCSYTQIFHDAEKLRRKPKIFVKVIQIFWNVQHAGLLDPIGSQYIRAISVTAHQARCSEPDITRYY